MIKAYLRWLRRLRSGKITRQQFKMSLPGAVAWASEQEQTILEWGVPLSGAQLMYAKHLGVVRPEQVRLLRVPAIPEPRDVVLSMAAEKNGLVSPHHAGGGMTLRYGIFVRNDCWESRRLIAHELVHTAQYERFGGIEAFLRAYLLECTGPLYSPPGPLEQEAVAKSAKLFPSDAVKPKSASNAGRVTFFNE